MFPFVGLVVLAAAFLLMAAFIPMPKGIRIGLYILAGLALLVIGLALLGVDGGYIRVPR